MNQSHRPLRHGARPLGWQKRAINPTTRQHMAWELVAALRKQGMDKTMDAFLTAMGGKKIKNPDTGRMVLYKSLKGPKGQTLLQTEFAKWKGEDQAAKGGGETPPSAAPTANAVKRQEYEKAWEAVRNEWDAGTVKVLKLYTKESYKDINKSLRSNTHNKKTAKWVDTLDHLFDSKLGKVVSDTVTHRAVGENHPLVHLMLEGKLDPGFTYRDPGYMSTSIDPTMSKTWGLTKWWWMSQKAPKVFTWGDLPATFQSLGGSPNCF